MKKVKLVDFIQIKVDPAIVELDSDTKVKILDSATSGEAATRGLIVTFDLSNSGRRINNRIYPPKGQQAGVKSWTEPFAKPILMNHDKHGEAIGRFISVEYVPLDSEAIEHLGSVRDFLEVKAAFDSGNPKKVYKTLDKFNLLTDSKWPGVGKLVAKARITDPDAIQKFLDGRYLTFSAGSHTNAYTCLACGSAWHNGDICEHRPGARDEDGLMGIFMTGDFYGDEGSVVNDPANVYSQVRHLEFDDSVDVSAVSAKIWESSADCISMTDSVITVAKTQKNNQTNLEDNQMLKQLMEMNVQEVAGLLFDNKLDFDLVDALAGASQLERAWLVRIHDALHYEYDYRLRTYDESNSVEDDGSLPADVFKLHGALHEISTSKDFRDSLMNGALDQFDSTGASSTEYVAERLEQTDSKSEDSELVNVLKGISDLLVQINTQKEDANVSEAESAQAVGPESAATDQQEDAEESAEENEEEVSTQEEEMTVQQDDAVEETEEVEEAVVDVPWGALDMALSFAIGADALDDEARAALEDKFFCGADRSFPIANQAHVDAARKVVETAGLSSAQQEKVLASIGEKEAMLNDGSSSDNETSVESTELEDLKQDYAESMKQVENLKSVLAKVLDAYAKIQEEDFSGVEDSERLAKMTQWFDNHQAQQDSEDTETSIETTDSQEAPAAISVEDVKAVDNPSVASSQDKKDSVKLSGFAQKIVNTYQSIKDEKGEEAAIRYYLSQRRYLPRNFDLDTHLN